MDVLHKDAKILREALAHVGNYGPPTLRKFAVEKLKQYAEAVTPYCDHVNQVVMGNVKACLDCGKREPYDG